MAADYYGHAFLGIIKDANPLRRKVRAFPHNHPADWKVDPISGKSLWVMQDGGDVLTTLDYGPGPSVDMVECGYETEVFAIGYDLCQCQGEDGELSKVSELSVADIMELAEPLKARLRKAGLDFKDADFGIHAVMNISV